MEIFNHTAMRITLYTQFPLPKLTATSKLSQSDIQLKERKTFRIDSGHILMIVPTWNVYIIRLNFKT